MAGGDVALTVLSAPAHPLVTPLAHLAPIASSHRRIVTETPAFSVRVRKLSGTVRALVVAARADSIQLSHCMGPRLFLAADEATHFPEPACRTPRTRDLSELDFLT